MKKILIIDGQGGKIGASLIDALRSRYPSGGEVELVAVGTNSSATEDMLRRSPDAAATGENPVVVACADADIIAGPIGIIQANALLGEITPTMALAVSESHAKKILIPMSQCKISVVGTQSMGLSEYIKLLVEEVRGYIQSQTKQ